MDLSNIHANVCTFCVFYIKHFFVMTQLEYWEAGQRQEDHYEFETNLGHSMKFLSQKLAEAGGFL